MLPGFEGLPLRQKPGLIRHKRLQRGVLFTKRGFANYDLVFWEGPTSSCKKRSENSNFTVAIYTSPSLHFTFSRTHRLPRTPASALGVPNSLPLHIVRREQYATHYFGRYISFAARRTLHTALTAALAHRTTLAGLHTSLVKHRALHTMRYLPRASNHVTRSARRSPNDKPL